MLNYFIVQSINLNKNFVKIDFNIKFLAEFPKNFINKPIFVIFS